MLQSGKTAQIKVAVTAMAANAQLLGALTMARALSECKRAPLILTDEVFIRVSTASTTEARLAVICI